MMNGKRLSMKKKFLIGACSITLLGVLSLTYTKARYKTTQDVPIVNGTINYELGDANLIGIYLQNGDDYTKSDTIPDSGYALNEEKSYCKIGDEVQSNMTITYDANTKALGVFPITKEGTKCYLYFDEYVPPRTMQEIVAEYNIGSRGSFSTAYTASTTNTVFTTSDWKGTSYYFAGAPTDNWVRFGGYYWRIVRVNGDGSVRLIYNGTSTTTTGEGTMINSSQAFNSSYTSSEYVGLKYTIGQQHGQNTDSSILDVLQSWYTSSGLSATQYSQYVDTSVGFCSARNLVSGSWSSTGSHYYSVYGRLVSNKNPRLSCTSTDIIAEPVGLISADEVAFAGGVIGASNDSYYLYNGQVYWTMSPSDFGTVNNIAIVFYVWNGGSIGSWSVNNTYGVRPVINLKADTKFQGSGTVDSPFEVVA